MKKILMSLIFFFCIFYLFAKDLPLKEYDYVTFLGMYKLHSEIDSHDYYTTLNHEGGLKCRILEINYTDDKIWLKIIIQAGLWTDKGVWIDSGTKFYIEYTDDMPFYSY